MAPWDFPPEYGTEHGERCDRGRCKGRMITERELCDCWDTALDEWDGEGDPPDTFTCTCGYVVVCNICGEGNGN